MESNIKNWIKNKNILVTGATGFVGKVLIEKLLRDCSDLERIFVVVRGKKGIDFNKRFEEFKKNIVRCLK